MLCFKLILIAECSWGGGSPEAEGHSSVCSSLAVFFPPQLTSCLVHWRSKTLALLEGGRLSPCTGFRGLARPAWCPRVQNIRTVLTLHLEGQAWAGPSGQFVNGQNAPFFLAVFYFPVGLGENLQSEGDLLTGVEVAQELSCFNPLPHRLQPLMIWFYNRNNSLASSL